MKKNFALLVAALGLSAALLTACTAPADSSQVTQPIASPDANAPANTKTSSVVSSQTADDAQTLPTAGESVSINTPQPTDVSGRITEADAKQIALDHAGISESETDRLRVKLDYDDGVQEYEVTFYVGNREYDYDINAATGEIRSHDSEIDDDYVSSTEAAGAAVSEDEARATVVARVSGASASDVRLHLERDDGRLVYEGELIYNGTEYEFQIDATTGDVLDWESESVRD